MSHKNKKPLILQTLFELRKVHSLPERFAAGRVFFIEDKLGLCDSSGAIWPVGVNKKHYDNTFLKQGDIISFKCHISKNKSNLDLKYNDSYFIEITEIINKTPCLENWENAVIPSPIPTKEFLFKQKDNLDSQEINTCFFNSPTSKRLKFIKQRNRSLDRVKLFFNNRGFINIETPTLVPSGGVEVYLNTFNTDYEDHCGKKWTLQLPTSPEFALKKIMSEGTNKVFQLSRAYRNIGEVSKQHEPEFVMLEWYRANATLSNMIEDTQNLVLSLSDFLGASLDLPKQWPIFRVDMLFKEILSIDLEEVQNKDDFYKAAKNLSLSLTEKDDWDSIFCKLFMEKIEPHLLQQKACFVTHYPIQMGALAAQETIYDNDQGLKQKPFVERMEAFLLGIEICNGYLELIDSTQLKLRFNKTLSERKTLIRDPLFENAMSFGLPPCAGNALGIDRVISILLGLSEIAPLYPLPFLSQFPKNSVAWE